MNPLPKPQPKFPSNHSHGYENLHLPTTGLWCLLPPTSVSRGSSTSPVTSHTQTPCSNQGATTSRTTQVEADTTQVQSCPCTETAPNSFVSRRGMIIAAAVGRLYNSTFPHLARATVSDTSSWIRGDWWHWQESLLPYPVVSSASPHPLQSPHRHLHPPLQNHWSQNQISLPLEQKSMFFWCTFLYLISACYCDSSICPNPAVSDISLWAPAEDLNCWADSFPWLRKLGKIKLSNLMLWSQLVYVKAQVGAFHGK